MKENNINIEEITKYLEDYQYSINYREDTIAILKEVNELREQNKEMKEDIRMFIGEWFLALEDEGCNPWEYEDSVLMAKKYNYTKKDYKEFLETII